MKELGKTRIVIYCVNYNSYDSLTDYLASIDKGASNVRDISTVKVVVADNTVPCTLVKYNAQNFELEIIPIGENKGYFGAIKHLMEGCSPENYDYSIISNVDVLLSEAFFSQLVSYKTSSDIGWIAPRIYSRTLNMDFNPQALQRYSCNKMKALKLLFKYPLLLRLKQKLLHQYREIKTHEAGPVYAGHGSLIILTTAFFRQCGIIDYPIFLYGEEIYLAELCRRSQLKVMYAPQIEVFDIGKISTGQIPTKQYCKYNYLALDYLIHHFFKSSAS